MISFTLESLRFIEKLLQLSCSFVMIEVCGVRGMIDYV